MQELTNQSSKTVLAKKCILSDDSTLITAPIVLYSFGQWNQPLQNPLFTATLSFPFLASSPKFLPRTKQQSLTADDLLNFEQTQNISTTFISLCRRRWQQEVYNRFREARKRFPEFFPCFDLRENSDGKLEYSIHFKPLTKYAKGLLVDNPLFPHNEEFKPIEELWNSQGKSQLDIIFERYPTQLELKVSKVSSWKLQLQEMIQLVQESVKKFDISSLKLRFSQRKAVL